MFPLTIKTVSTENDFKSLAEFIKTQPRYYPNFTEWVDQKCIPRLQNGISKAFIVVSSDNKVVGNAVYQHIDGGRVAIKNFRIDRLYRNRDLGHFLLTQVFYESGSGDIVLDVTVDNFSAVEFFIHNKFKIVSKEKLYLPTQDEFVMVREHRS